MPVIVASGTEQRHCLGMPGDCDLVPVAGAVHVQLGDPPLVVELAEECLAAVPLLATVVPALLDLDRIAGLSGEDLLDAGAAGGRVEPGLAVDRLLEAVPLNPPVRQRDVG